MQELHVDLGNISYDIKIAKGLRHTIGTEIKNIFNGRKIALITDENVDKYYGSETEKSLKNQGFDVRKIVLKAGEKTKSFNSLMTLYNEFIDFNLTRSDLIITMGGGVIGDLGGFAAATYLRGIKFVQFPTSLLAQVDSSVGGKVAVDLEKGKNLVGAFYHPSLVIIDSEMLDTLPDRVFNDGMGEVIKYGLIGDKELFDKLYNAGGRNDVMKIIDDVIHTCCDIKRIVVEKDEKDTGLRMILNFGHTIGHAIEKYFNFEKYTHGEAISIGMYEITKISEEKGLTEKGTADRIINILVKYDLPYDVKIDNKEEIIDTISLDKKNLNNVLNLIVLDKIGSCRIIKESRQFFIK
ncbi:3-dehydroquinate synthase [Inconstantimicrobium porci]|uniref:3-dehydroquinate synthase n=1 Tax=Inconstantimicrobium porci TaxID=2652291 RepID=A0A7X2MXQ8_9CLOT|nr:3-dehydroquinate synthase [Inconstantimicrobium porci]MSR90560.1 3-dehydroquinate synthase [Inconstantimicrobium porci]